jgi:hypothetical protein
MMIAQTTVATASPLLEMTDDGLLLSLLHRWVNRVDGRHAPAFGLVASRRSIADRILLPDWGHDRVHAD